MPARTTETVAGFDQAASGKEPRFGGLVAAESRARRALGSRELVAVLVGLGILLRLVQYVANRSLWIDEASLALNLIERPLSELTRQLAFNQAAPIGFLLIEGIGAKAIGYSEYVLRFFPLVCGLASIPAFAWLSRRTVSREAAPLAILLFCVANGLVYYASELKPYETDVAVAVGFLAAGTFLATHARLSRASALVIALAGLVSITLSFPALLVLAAVTLTFAARIAFDSRLQLRSPASFVVMSWALAAIAVVSFAATKVRLVRDSFEAASGQFLGVSGSSSFVHAVNVAATNIATAIGFPQQRPFNQIEKLALLCALAGAIALLRRKPTQLSMLVISFPLLLVASALHAYPISERTELFLVPAIVLLIAEGVAQLVRLVPARAQVVTALLLAGLVAAGPVWLAAKRLVHPSTHEEIKPVLEFVRDHWRPGDTLYVHYAAQYALLYYEECKCLRLSSPRNGRDLWPMRPLSATGSEQYAPAAVPLSSDVVLGRYFGINQQPEYIADFNRVAGRHRVWFLFSHLNAEWEKVFIQMKLLPHINSLGTRISGIDRPGAHAYLFRMGSSN
jgi:hypothetical protein